MNTTLKFSYKIGALLLASHFSCWDVQADSDVLIGPADLEAAKKRMSSKKFAPVEDGANPADKKNTTINSGDASSLEEWRKQGQAYVDKANAAKTNTDKEYYFQEAAKSWEKVSSNPQAKRLAADAYVDAASFAGSGIRKRYYYLRAAWMYKDLGQQGQFEEMLRLAEYEQ